MWNGAGARPSVEGSTFGTFAIRPELRYAWYGPSVLVTNHRGECGTDQHLSGYYFRETRFLRELRLEIDGQRPWLCAAGTGDQHTLALNLSYPELPGHSGGGSGTGGDHVPRDDRGVPNRALDLRTLYEAGFRGLKVTLLITNRSLEHVTVELAWWVGGAERPVRDVIVSGMGKVLSLAGTVAPRVTDRYMERSTFEAQMTRLAVNTARPDNLYEPVAYDGGERGKNWRGRVHARSIYTASGLRVTASRDGRLRSPC